MKNFKLSRNLLLFSGFCFLLSTILQLASSKFVIIPIINGIACILFFINAYIYHKKIIKDNKD